MVCADEDFVKIQWINDDKEFGIVAANDLPAGTVLLEEEPIVSAQYLFNKRFFPACEFCLKSLETPEEMLARLSGLGQEDIPVLPNSNSTEHPCRFPCHSCEHEIYCSEECRKKAWISYHNRLCLGARYSDPEHPLNRLADEWRACHFPPESATIMLLAKMIAQMLNWLDQSMPVDEVLETFNSMKHDYQNQELNLLHRCMDEKYESRLNTMRGLLKQALYDSRLDEVFSKSGFVSLFCAMALNGQGIGSSSLEKYKRDLIQKEPMDEETELVLEQLEVLEPVIEEHSGEFTHAEGSGLYALHSKLNHSCSPNAEIQFPYNNSTLQIVLKRPVQAGEEICISYIELNDDDDNLMEIEEEIDDGEYSDEGSSCDQGSDVQSRREMLRQFYLFECQCSKCVQESQACV